MAHLVGPVMAEASSFISTESGVTRIRRRIFSFAGCRGRLALGLSGTITRCYGLTAGRAVTGIVPFAALAGIVALVITLRIIILLYHLYFLHWTYLSIQAVQNAVLRMTNRQTIVGPHFFSYSDT